MAGGFDPYHKWLGVPSREQPPNYYRLLGLEIFEEDLDAIECTADRLIKYVRDVATAEQRQFAREILDELSAAKRCLLIAEQKRAYDAGLRAGQTANRKPTYAQPPSQVNRPSPPRVTPVVAQRVATRRQTNSAPKPSLLITASVATLLIGAGGLGVFLLRGNARPKQLAAETPTVSDSTEIADELDVVVGVMPEPTTESPVSERQQPTVEASVPDRNILFAESTLPEFNLPTPAPNLANDEELVDAHSTSAELASEPDSADETDSMSEVGTEEEFVGSDERRGLLQDIWNDVIGNKVEAFIAHVAEHPEPDQSEIIDRFETPEDFDDQYGQRLRGYLHPSITGEYEFSIRANAEGWLYVSTDATPENLRRVEPGTDIALRGGEVYYVEAFHKESTGRDYLSVGWKMPNGIEEKPIPGERLTTRYRIVPRHEREFVVLKPLSAESSSGADLDLLEAGNLLSTSPSRGNEIYKVTFETEIETMTALRLEAVSHESLPASGPGRGIGGRFAIAEIAATTDGDTPTMFLSAVDDEGRDLRRLFDRDDKTSWRVSGRGNSSAATLVIQNPTMYAGGTTLQMELKQREGLGHFRVLATSAPDPHLVSRRQEEADEALYSLFVNLGGDDFTTPDGVQWKGSKLFDHETFGHEGGRGVSEDLIANKVQGSAQRGISAFRAVVPVGTYDVALYFCEYWSTTPSSRRFAIAVEQQIVAANFDLFRTSGGFATPLVYPVRNVTVNDGRLDIQFRTTVDGASTILNAVSIRQVR